VRAKWARVRSRVRTARSIAGLPYARGFVQCMNRVERVAPEKVRGKHADSEALTKTKLDVDEPRKLELSV